MFKEENNWVQRKNKCLETEAKNACFLGLDGYPELQVENQN